MHVLQPSPPTHLKWFGWCQTDCFLVLANLSEYHKPFILKNKVLTIPPHFDGKFGAKFFFRASSSNPVYNKKKWWKFVYCILWGCDPSIFQPPKPPNKKTANGAPTWKASTLNLQCFDYTTAAQLFHHQLAFHVAFAGGGKCFPYLSWPWKGWHFRIWHWFIDTRDVSPFKDGGKKVQWKHWNYIFNNWEFEFPTQKLENSQSAGIRTSLSTKPNQQTARLWIWWLEDNPFVLEWSFHGTSKYSLFKGHIN